MVPAVANVKDRRTTGGDSDGGEGEDEGGCAGGEGVDGEPEDSAPQAASARSLASRAVTRASAALRAVRSRSCRARLCRIEHRLADSRSVSDWVYRRAGLRRPVPCCRYRGQGWPSRHCQRHPGRRRSLSCDVALWRACTVQHAVSTPFAGFWMLRQDPECAPDRPTCSFHAFCGIL